MKPQISMAEKFQDWLFKQGAALVISICVSCWYLFVDRPEMKSDMRACEAKYDKLNQYIIDEFGAIVSKNTEQQAETNRTVRLYFHNLTEPE
jgi:hypothetical protein